MRARSRNEIAFFVLIAVVAAGITALAFRFIPAAAGGGGSANAVTGAAAVAGPRDTITVIGEGTTLASPDIAVLNLGVQAKRGSVRDALSAANSEMTKLLANIKAAGVAEADIQTTSLGISQNTDCCPSRISGYTASNSVVVKIHHLSNVGAIIATAADAAGDDIALNGVTPSREGAIGVGDRLNIVTIRQSLRWLWRLRRRWRRASPGRPIERGRRRDGGVRADGLEKSSPCEMVSPPSRGGDGGGCRLMRACN
jgi:hypothetical protein